MNTNPNANIPPPALNGGLYTGVPFQQNAPWANVQMRPSSAYMTRLGLEKVDIDDVLPPSMAYYQMTPGFRPGNNTDDTINGLVSCYGLSCVNQPPCVKKAPKCQKIIQID
jgi:hypothetical protein